MLIILIALNGHFLTQRPQPMHNTYEIYAIVEVGITSIHNLSVLLTGHVFLHSCLHFFGLHFYLLIIAILCFVSYIVQLLLKFINIMKEYILKYLT
jgi:predicted small secreted protein